MEINGKKLSSPAVSIEKAYNGMMNVTVWTCFDHGPFSDECPRNCDEKTFQRCETNKTAGKCLAVVDEW